MESLLEQSDVARQKGRRWRKIRNTIFLILFFCLAIWFFIRFYYPYGEGVKSGQLNYVVYKGYVFKTYEGKLIQSGIKSSTAGGIQSNEFVFSISDKNVADKLMLSSGKTVDLHYKEYFGAIPWRGYSRYVVDSIVNISEEAAPINETNDVPINSMEM